MPVPTTDLAVQFLGAFTEPFKLLELTAEYDRPLMLRQGRSEQTIAFAAAGTAAEKEMIGRAIDRLSLWSRQRCPEFCRLPLDLLLQLRRFRLLEH